jgi:hypothetical protein
VDGMNTSRMSAAERESCRRKLIGRDKRCKRVDLRLIDGFVISFVASKRHFPQKGGNYRCGSFGRLSTITWWQIELKDLMGLTYSRVEEQRIRATRTDFLSEPRSWGHNNNTRQNGAAQNIDL